MSHSIRGGSGEIVGQLAFFFFFLFPSRRLAEGAPWFWGEVSLRNVRWQRRQAEEGAGWVTGLSTPLAAQPGAFPAAHVLVPVPDFAAALCTGAICLLKSHVLETEVATGLATPGLRIESS